MKTPDDIPDITDDVNIYSDSRRYAKQNERKSVKKPKKTAWKVVLISLAVFIVLAGIGSVAAITYVRRPIDTVASLSASDITDSSMRLSWEKVERADGYHLYLCENGGDDFDLFQTVEDPDTLTLELSGLEQAAQYSFFITAYNQYVESENSAVLQNVWTYPEQIKQLSLSSDEEGVINAHWSANEKADGYLVEYRTTDEDYTKEHTLRIENADTVSTNIEELEPNEEYAVRVCSYISREKEMKSAYSEEETVTVYQKPIVPDLPVTDPNIDPAKPMIALSFDDGPLGGAGGRILDILEKNGAKATFFMVGCYAEDDADNLRRKVSLGMELGNHTWNHAHYGDDVTAEDIRKCSEAIYDATGKYPTAFRSPGGMTTDAILAECANEGMPAYYWSIDTRDWETRDAEAVYDEVMDHVQDGDIILMHEIYDSTADAVEKMVPELIEKGYQLVTCHDLMVAKTGEEPTAGVQYYHAR
ncbi:MAG: polysaccharide deacetylase family protein [Ruminococcus sp.]|nr:polysaccharide deacetylase family protein [Ruminococcus sp.]